MRRPLAYLAIFLLNYSTFVCSEYFTLLPDEDSEFALVLDENIWLPGSKAHPAFLKEFYLRLIPNTSPTLFKGKAVAYKDPKIDPYDKYCKSLEINFFRFDLPGLVAGPITREQMNAMLYVTFPFWRNRYALGWIDTYFKSVGHAAFEVQIQRRLEPKQPITFRLYVMNTDPYYDEDGECHLNAYFIFIINRKHISSDQMDKLCAPIMAGIVPLVKTND